MAIRKIKLIPPKEQEEIAKLILEELSWEQTLKTNQEKLSSLAKEANEEYQSGKTSEQDW